MNRKIRWTIGLTLTVFLIGYLLYTPDIPLDSLKSKYTNASSEFVEIQGMPVHFRREGSGPTLVLIHGTAASLHTWDDWTQSLSRDFEVLRMDLPAFGLTGPRQDGDYSMKNYVSFVSDFLASQNIDSCYMGGNSLGGAIAWNYAIDYPQQVQKLILLDAAGAPRSGDLPFIFKLANTPLLSRLLTKVTPRSIIRSNIQQVYFDDDLISEKLIDRYHDMSRRPGNRQAFVDRAQKQFELETNRLVEIKCPTLIQWGVYDEWIPVEDAQFFENKIPNSRVLLYQNAGHVPMEEIPDQTSKDAKSFLLEQDK